jgi:hypothetical protein
MLDIRPVGFIKLRVRPANKTVRYFKALCQRCDFLFESLANWALAPVVLRGSTLKAQFILLAASILALETATLCEVVTSLLSEAVGSPTASFADHVSTTVLFGLPVIVACEIAVWIAYQVLRD